MKTTLINEICGQMNQHLTEEQNRLLQDTLQRVFRQFDIPDNSLDLAAHPGNQHPASQSVYRIQEDRRMLREHTALLLFNFVKHAQHNPEKRVRHRDRRHPVLSCHISGHAEFQQGYDGQHPPDHVVVFHMARR